MVLLLIFLLIIMTVIRLRKIRKKKKEKRKIAGRTANDGTKNVKIRVPLKYLSNFWRTLEISLIVKLILFYLGLRDVFNR